MFYRWLKRYKREGKVTPKKPKRAPTRRVPEKNVLKIISLVRLHPLWATRRISEVLGKDKKGRAVVGNHGVQNIFKRLNLNTEKKRKKFAQEAKGLTDKEALDLARGIIPERKPVVRRAPELSPQQRLQAIERVVKYKEPVSKVCIDFHISRPNFYKWLKRYQAAPKDKKLEALQTKKAEVKRYYGQTPEKYEEVVLSIVAQYPEFGVGKILQALPQIAGKSIVGHHGVQNVLRRHDLNTYEKRLAYARAQVTPPIRLISSLKELGTRFIYLPTETRVKIVRFASTAFVTAFLTTAVLGFLGYMAVISAGVPATSRIGLFFASVALGVGSIFLAYSMKYYLTLAIVLSFSRQPLEEGGGLAVTFNGRLNGNHKNGGWLARIFGLNGNGPSTSSGLNGRNGIAPAGGLQPSLEHIKLKRYPFVSIHLPFYNEMKVAERILTACTSMDYPNFEIVVIDDSTDGTTKIVQRYANKHNAKYPNGPKIKVLHRPSRQGFKGGALAYALKRMNSKAEFVVVFDADFVPYPDTLELFIKYFKANNSSPNSGQTQSEDYTKSNVAVIGGYQWHVLNKSENWITRGVRCEYAGSYVIERPGREIMGLLKQISGSVYMIRADLLKKVGWGTSITEDFELTLKLYEQGYKVIYTPYVQAPAECVSTLKRLIRQRMRWSEGHSNVIKRMFKRLITSSNLTLPEKLEVFYLSPYYLQAAFFLVGTFCWLLAETVFRARLPFWTSLWGWSLVLTNFFSLPLMNAVGLFLEESEEKDYLGLLSFIALSYIMVPFQAYASVKGFLEKEEGPWFRTPKTGKITDIFTRGRFYRWVTGIIPGRRPTPAVVSAVPVPERMAWLKNPYVALATANNQFDSFEIKPKRLRWVSKAVLAILLIFSVSLYHLSFNVSDTYAAMKTDDDTVFSSDGPSGQISLAQQLTDDISANDCAAGTDCPSIARKKTGYLQWRPGTENNPNFQASAPTATNGYGWILDGDINGESIAAGTWTFYICVDGIDTDGDSNATPYIKVWKVNTNGTTITAESEIFSGGATSVDDVYTDGTGNYYTITQGGVAQVDFDGTRPRLYVEYWINKTSNGDAIVDITRLRVTGGESCAGSETKILTPDVTVPEFVLVFIFIVPFIPFLVRKKKFKLAVKEATE